MQSQLVSDYCLLLQHTADDIHPRSLFHTAADASGGDRHHHQELKPKRSMFSSTIQNTIINETF